PLRLQRATRPPLRLQPATRPPLRLLRAKPPALRPRAWQSLRQPAVRSVRQKRQDWHTQRPMARLARQG
ncbi:MAG: hypothetical protein ACR2IK_08670, partial [Chloroflexota bacterium]